METVNQVGTFIKDKVNYVESNFKYLLDNPYIMAVLKISLILYASQIAPTLPTKVSSVFQNTFVKILLIALISYLAETDFQLSILLAIVFVLSINLFSERGFFESFNNIEDYGHYYADKTKYQTLLGQPAAISSATLLDGTSDQYSGCDDIKLADLLAVFQNDQLKLQNTVQYAYNSLIQQLPSNSDAMTNLMKISKAVGLPGNMEFTDATAPYIATILIQYGIKINKTCQAPYQTSMINQ